MGSLRFNNSVLRGLANSSGPGSLASAILNADRVEQMGRDEEWKRLAEQAEFRQKLSKAEDEAQLRSPASQQRRALLANGVPLDAAQDVEQHLNTGRIDRFDTGGLPGPVLPTPAWADKGNLSRVAQSLAGLQAVAAGESKGQEDYFKGANQQFETALARAIVDGSAPAPAMQRGMALLKASPIFDQSESGAVLNRYGGAVDTANPVARATLALREAQAGAQKANAVQSYASAARSRQLAASGGSGGGGGSSVGDGPRGKPPSGYRWNAGGTALEAIPGGPADAKLKKPMAQLPPASLKLQQEATEAIGTASAVNADLTELNRQLVDGELELSPRARASAFIRNNLGMSDSNSQKLATFQATLERLRNESLRLNKGVQTEGDSERAWRELVANINDTEVVKRRLQEIVMTNRRAQHLHQLQVDQIRANYGLDPMEIGQGAELPAAVGDAAASGGGADLAAAAAAELRRRQQAGKGK